MKKKRGRTSSSSNHRTSNHRSKNIPRISKLEKRSHEHIHQHSRLVLWILLTLALAVFLIAILVVIQIPLPYLRWCLIGFLLLVLLELGFYLRQEHSFHSLRILPKGQIRTHLQERFHSHQGKKHRLGIQSHYFHLPRIHRPNVHFPTLNLTEKLKQLKKSWMDWKLPFHIPQFKRKHYSAPKIVPKRGKKITVTTTTSSRKLLKHFFSFGHAKHPAPQIPVEKQKKVETAKEERTTPKSIHLGTYETEIDAVYKEVKEKGKIRIDEIAKKWNVASELVQEWAKILEEHKLVQIHYPAFGSPELRMYEEKKSGEGVSS